MTRYSDSVLTRYSRSCVSTFAVAALAAPVALALFAGQVSAQAAPSAGAVAADKTTAAPEPRPNWLITPSAAIECTYTDNALLQSAKKSDFITRLSPGVQLKGRSSRAEGNLNYQLSQFTYAEKSASNSLQKSLVANGKLELVDRWLYVEGSQNVSRHQVSAFATQGVLDQPGNQNSTETAAYSLSPRIQGRLAGLIDYQLRYSTTRSRSSAGALAGGSAVTTRAWNGQFGGATPLALVSWSVTGDSQIVNQPGGGDSRNQRLLGTLGFALDPQIKLLLNAGRESDNFTSSVMRHSSTLGLGLDWAPTERTQVSLKSDKRSYGDTFSINFNHRTGLSAWKFTDSRDVRTTAPTLAQAKTGTAYDLVYLQLASQFPDPSDRAAEASRQLARAGIAADAPTFGSLLTSQVFNERRQLASLALMGVNNTVILAVDRSESTQLGGGTGIVDDFTLSSSIRQAGVNASWAHKLTPDAALTLNAHGSRSQGQGNLDTSLRSWSLQFTTKLGAKTTAGASLRQNRSTSATGTGYDETAAVGSLRIDF